MKLSTIVLYGAAIVFGFATATPYNPESPDSVQGPSIVYKVMRRNFAD